MSTSSRVSTGHPGQAGKQSRQDDLMPALLIIGSPETVRSCLEVVRAKPKAPQRTEDSPVVVLVRAVPERAESRADDCRRTHSEHRAGGAPPRKNKATSGIAAGREAPRRRGRCSSQFQPLYRVRGPAGCQSARRLVPDACARNRRSLRVAASGHSWRAPVIKRVDRGIGACAGGPRATGLPTAVSGLLLPGEYREGCSCCSRLTGTVRIQRRLQLRNPCSRFARWFDGR